MSADTKVCECSFPKFVVDDGIQSCIYCGLNDHYKNGVVADWSDDEEEEEEDMCEICGEDCDGCGYIEEIKKLQEKYGIKTDKDGVIILGYFDSIPIILTPNGLRHTVGSAEEVKCEDCGKTVCEVGATKQSCRIKAFWEKYDAEEDNAEEDEDGEFISYQLGDKHFDCAECIGCFENGKDYCKGCGFDMNIWNEKDEEEESDSDSEEEQDCIDNDDHKMLECVECEECFPDYEDFKTKDNFHYCEACSLILENK